MRVVASTLWYPPHRYIGSELMTHQMLTRLVRRGHDVTVVTKDPVEPYTWGGINVTDGPAPAGDILIYHVDYGHLASEWRGPKVGIAHNSRLQVQIGVRNTTPNILTVNSLNTSKEVPYHGKKMVVHPPVTVPDEQPAYIDRYCITLINLESTSKVGPFWEVAASLPDYQFLGVKGGYGEQAIPDRLPPNVEILDQLPPSKMREVWDRTSILLVPSASESWSMVASEAMAHSTPVIANCLPGLWENLRGVAEWAERDDPRQWVNAIKRINDAWDDYSQAALTRAKKQEATFDLEVEQWCDALEKLCR